MSRYEIINEDWNALEALPKPKPEKLQSVRNGPQRQRMEETWNNKTELEALREIQARQMQSFAAANAS